MAVDEFVKEGYTVTAVAEMNEDELVKNIKGVHCLGVRYVRARSVSSVSAPHLLFLRASCPAQPKKPVVQGGNPT